MLSKAFSVALTFLIVNNYVNKNKGMPVHIQWSIQQKTTTGTWPTSSMTVKKIMTSKEVTGFPTFQLFTPQLTEE